ncbi:type II toxin-antitoxin system RelE/ParE family toxin [Carboxylicivirga sp. N1Y90]|uniref:type II toxin-antitoxin system RelE/ParE family toxin n=1 Tax=Carboxylicivirga fragile TaxID=3417571 RepID=UPI003D328B2A|nr:type II toxin-antitoxin system RelE/ParE family toxin [Marinilabiliaceae bacterium N1Y90]
MKDIYKLIWTDEALNGLKEIFNYFERRFAKKDTQEFARKLDERLELLKTSPKTFAFTNKSKNIRRTVIARLTSVYYRIEGNEVQIISVFDNRQNPDILKQ